MFNINSKLLVLPFLLSLPIVSFAKEISYDYVQGIYSKVTADTGTTAGDLEGTGLGISGSFSVAPAIAITAGFSTLTFDELLGVDSDVSDFRLGVTGHFSIAKNIDIYGNFSVIRGKVEVKYAGLSYDDTDTGNIIGVGMRFLPTNIIELEIAVARIDIFDESTNSYGGNIRFYATKSFSLGAGYATSDDSDTITFIARYDFK